MTEQEIIDVFGMSARGVPILLEVGSCRVTVRGETGLKARALALNSLAHLAEHYWSSKGEIVPLAQSLGVPVTSSNTVAEIKAEIATEAANA